LHVFISHPELLQDLCAHLKRSGLVVDGCYGREVKVRPPDGVSTAQARRELDVYLAVWQALHPGIEAYILRPSGVG
jgi:hypothetical protein